MNATEILAAELKNAASNGTALVKRATDAKEPTYFVAGGKTPATTQQIIAAMTLSGVVIRFV